MCLCVLLFGGHGLGSGVWTNFSLSAKLKYLFGDFFFSFIFFSLVGRRLIHKKEVAEAVSTCFVSTGIKYKQHASLMSTSNSNTISMELHERERWSLKCDSKIKNKFLPRKRILSDLHEITIKTEWRKRQIDSGWKRTKKNTRKEREPKHSE